MLYVFFQVYHHSPPKTLSYLLVMYIFQITVILYGEQLLTPIKMLKKLL